MRALLLCLAVCRLALALHHTVPLYGSASTGYCANVTIAGPQQFCALVDTASSNFAVAADPSLQVSTYFHTELADDSFTQLSQDVSVMYIGGSWSGRLALANVSISGSHSATAYFTLISSAKEFFAPSLLWQGILGVGPRALAQPGRFVEPVFDSLLEAAAGDWEDVFTLQLCPSPRPSSSTQTGSMVLGGVSAELYSGALHYTAMTNGDFYSVLLTNISVGSSPLDLSCSEFNNGQTILDSGTIDIHLPPSPFAALTQTLSQHFAEPGALAVPETFWRGGAKLAWPSSSTGQLFSAFPNLHFGLAVAGQPTSEFSLELPPQLYLRSVSGSSQEQLETNCLPECDFFVFGVRERESGSVLGAAVMLAFATVFDRAQMRIGFATSTCDYSHNPFIPRISGPYSREAKDCHCRGSCGQGPPYWQVTAYACAAVVLPLTVILVVCALCARWRRGKHPHDFNRLTDHTTVDTDMDQTSPQITGQL